MFVVVTAVPEWKEQPCEQTLWCNNNKLALLD